MHDHLSVETILARLMPPALSTGGQMEIEQMIDDLAGPPETARRWPLIAAALATGFFIVHIVHRELPRLAENVAIDLAQGFTLVSESGRVEDMIEEGWSDTPDGSTMRTLRLHVVEESRLLDESTGIVMNISQPREEILLMPVSAF